MGRIGPTSVLLCAAPSANDEVGQLLTTAGHAVHRDTLAAEPDPTRFGLIVVDGGGGPAALTCCRRLRGRLGDGSVPLLLLLDDPAPAVRLAGLEAGADVHVLRPFLPGELLAQVRTLLRLRQVQHRLADQTSEMHAVHQRLQQAYQQIDLELEAARRLQRSFLPQTLPDVPGVRLAVQYRPCGRVGGDFYDVFRLDEDHIGFYVADAMGHGVPASLLTIFLKRGVCGKEISGQQYRLVPPGEVLERLNQDLLAQALPEMPFITMVYVLFNFRTGTLRFARAGHPHPLYVPASGALALLPGNGGLLGVFVTSFTEQTHQLHPGDKLLLCTDGLDTSVMEGGAAVPQLQACAEQHRALPIEDYVPRLAQELLGAVVQADDFTLLGVEVTR